MMKTTGNAMDQQATDAVVIGGGLAGMTAATLLARAGRRVTVYEKSKAIGGRAVTSVYGEFRFNLGPHALYRGGPGHRILTDLGVKFSGGIPAAAGGYAVDAGVKHTLPGGFVSLLTTGLLRLPAKFELARLLGSVQKIEAQAIQHVSVRQWLDSTIRQPDVRRLIQALFRLSTYANDPARQSAGNALAQLQLAVSKNVTYLDGGWQVLVDGLRDLARAGGVCVETSAKVVAIDHAGEVRGVRLADGRTQPTSAVLLAIAPDEAAALLDGAPGAALRQWAADAIAVKAACLDVAVSRLPQPRALFALGIDRPWYLSVHSAVARLAAPGTATIQVAKYLAAAESTDPRSDERELEGLLDLVQPGWRQVTVERRFLPNMLVSHALVTAAAGGAAGRPGPPVPGVANLYVVGDWVGAHGLLADASLASAQQAAELIKRNGIVHEAVAA